MPVMNPSCPAAGREVWTRAEAIGRLREALVKLCGTSRSMCQAAADLGVFCGGFRRWPAREFHELWKPYIGVSTHLNRAQMERFADLWQISEQIHQGLSLTCDAQVAHPGVCRGWDEFSHVDLARFCGEILGREVDVKEGQPVLNSTPCGETGEDLTRTGVWESRVVRTRRIDRMPQARRSAP